MDLVLVTRGGSSDASGRSVAAARLGEHPLRRAARAEDGFTQWFAKEAGRLPTAHELLLVLAVPSVTPTLELELVRMGWEMPVRNGGYGDLGRGPFRGMLVVIDEVARAEQDDLLRVFGHDKIQTAETRMWLAAHTVATGVGSMAELEGFEEVVRKLMEALPVEERLAGLTPEERLAGLAPEHRLAGLAAEERMALLATLPSEVLRALPEEFLTKLPASVRDAIARRIASEPS